MTIYFSEEYHTGIKELDDGHQFLIFAFNAVHFFLIDNPETTAKKSYFDLLLKITKSHFHAEEEILGRLNHPDKEAHAKEHQKLEKELDEITRKYDPDPLKGELIGHLEKWLTPHILNWDRKIKMASPVTPPPPPATAVKALKTVGCVSGDLFDVNYFDLPVEDIAAIYKLRWDNVIISQSSALGLSRRQGAER